MNYGEQIWQDIQNIVNKKTGEFRVAMDSNVHCMDVGIAALKASDPDIDYATKEKLHRLFRKEFFVFTSLEEAILHCRNTDNVDRSSFVEDPQLGDYIVAPSYSTLRSRVTNSLKSAKFESSFTGTDSTGKTVTNIGHLSLKDSTAATTPLETKLQQLLAALDTTPIAASLVSSRLNQLHRFHKAETSYAFNRASFDLNKLQGILGTATVFVTLQTSLKNNALSILETKIEREISAYLRSETFRKKLLKVHGSNTIAEDVFGAIYATLAKKNTVPGSKHSPKPVKKSSTNLLNPKAVTVTRPGKAPKEPSPVNLTSLLAFINKHLQSVVSANMGGGDRRDILNYRTGRFAASAVAQRLTLSRKGMITAFYSYMKNPYATFSKGGRQSSPASRDPKLLISKSIREIAAERVSNRLRAVVV